jgi:hypothetical protein
LKDVVGSGIASARSLGLVLIFAVVIVWQVPHVLFLRYSLLIILGALCWGTAYAVLAGRSRAGSIPRDVRTPFLWYAAFLGWMLVVAVVGRDFVESLGELRAEWLPTTLILLLGFGAGIRFARPAAADGNAAVQALFWGLVAHAVLQLLVAAGTLFESEAFPVLNFGGISDHKSNVTYTNTLALAMLLADAARERGSQLAIGRKMKLAIFAVLLASTIVSVTRNGLIVFVMLTVIGGLVALRYKTTVSRQWWAAAGACVAVLALGTWAGLRSDTRWANLLDTIPIAWNIEGERAWLNGETDFEHLPKTAKGNTVDASAYYRIAFAKVGVELIREHPWGTEIGRGSYTAQVHEKYGTAGMSHGHNGLIDLGVSTGIPGMLLWLAFLVSLAALGWKAWHRDRASVGLALVLAVIGFGLRMLMDATLRDHIIEEFAMVAGVLMGAIAYCEGARHRGPA